MNWYKDNSAEWKEIIETVARELFFYIDKVGLFDTSLLIWYNYLYGKNACKGIYRKEFV